METSLSTCAKYLAVAVFEGILTPSQCIEIKLTQDQLKRQGLDYPRCGELAVSLGMISSVDAERIAAKKKHYDDSDRLFVDPMTTASLSKGITVSKRTALISLYVISVVVVIAIITITPKDGALAHAGLVLSFIAFFGFSPIRDLATSRDMEVGEYIITCIRVIAVSAIAVTIAYIFWCMNAANSTIIEHIDRQIVNDIASSNNSYSLSAIHDKISSLDYLGSTSRLLRRSFYALLVVLPILCIHALVAIYRRREAKYSYLRKVLQLYFAHLCHKQDDAESREQKITTMLTVLASEVRLCSYDKFFYSLRFLFGPTTTATVWYLEPLSKQNTSLTASDETIEFRIVAVASSGAPDYMQSALDRIREKHRPKWNRSRVNSTIAKCKDSTGKTDKKKFVQFSDRDEFASLTGWIYSRNGVEVEDNAFGHMWLIENYYSCIDRCYKDIEKHLQVRSFAGYVVRNKRGDAAGVLLLCRNRTHAVLPWARYSLCRAAHSIGIALT